MVWQKILCTIKNKYYYYNQEKECTSWTPPPPEEKEEEEAREEIIIIDEEEKKEKSTRGDLWGFGMVSKPPIPVSGQEHLHITHPNEPPTIKTALERTKNTDGVKKKDLIEWCKQEGLPFSGLKADLVRRLDAHWKQLHKREKTDFLLSDCFKPKISKLERTRAKPKRGSKKGKGRKPRKPGERRKDDKSINEIDKYFGKGKHTFINCTWNGNNQFVTCKCRKNSTQAPILGDIVKFKNHLLTNEHKNWIKAQSLTERKLVQQCLKEQRSAQNDNEDDAKFPEQAAFRQDTLRAWLIAGIPLARLDKIRPYLERVSHWKLTHSNNLVTKYIDGLVKAEDMLFREALRNRVGGIAIITDNTPRLGDVFALLLRFVKLDDNGIPQITQWLVDVRFLQESMTAVQLAWLVTTTLAKYGLTIRDIDAFITDGCGVNGKAVRWMKQNNDGISLLDVLCFSHCGNNAGEEEEFVVLTLFWKHIQNMFRSYTCCVEWSKVTSAPMPKYSGVRWWAKFEVLDTLFNYFGDLRTVVTTMVEHKNCKESAPKLLLMFEDPATLDQLKIELAAYVEILQPLQRFTTYCESDGDVAFTVGAEIHALEKAYEEGWEGRWPSVNALIARAVERARTDPTVAALREATRERTQWKPRSSIRPKRRAAQGVSRAVDSISKAAKARRALEKAEKEKKDAAEFDALLEKEAKAQCAAPPTTKEEWHAHIKQCLSKPIQYITSRLFEEGGHDGDSRFHLANFYCDARIFDPCFAAKLNEEDAMEFIDGLKYHAVLIKFIPGLKETFRAYRRHAKEFKGIPGKYNILHYHLDAHGEDSPWYMAAVKVAIVCPSSAGAERVFSLLQNLWSEKQTATLSDRISLTLKSNMNKRLI